MSRPNPRSSYHDVNVKCANIANVISYYYTHPRASPAMKVQRDTLFLLGNVGTGK